MLTSLLRKVDEWGRARTLALRRRAIIAAGETDNDKFFLHHMTDDELFKHAEMDRKQQRYALDRRAWAWQCGRPIRQTPRSAGRLK